MVDKTKSTRKAKRVAKITKSSIKVSLINSKGERSGSVALSEAIFGQKPNKVLLAQAVRVFLSNQRHSHAKTKRRGEVKRSTRKIYRQKGTGGARHGARSAPIFVGGGIAHGPRGLQNYHLKLSQKMAKKALISALSARAQRGELVVADLEGIEAKTSILASLLQKNKLDSLTLVYTSPTIQRAGRNIEGLNPISASTLSAYEALVGKALLLTKEALQSLEARLGGKA